jgi:hypothetical protein
MKILRTSFWSDISCAHAPGYCITFISFSLFDLSNIRFSKKSIFTSCSVLTDFCHYLYLPLDLFLFELWSRNFWGSCYSRLFFNGCYTWVETEPKEWIYYLAYTNVANKNCAEFCMNKVFKCRETRMMRWDEGWTKAQAWGYPCHPKKCPRSTSIKSWGCPRHSFFINKNIRSSFKTLYFYCFLCYVFFLERLYFCFQFYFVLFAAINGCITQCFFWRETRSIFHCQEHSSFHSYRSTSVLFF